MTKLDKAKKTISLIRQASDRAIVFYSGGKDSIMLLDLVAAQFDHVYVVFMYFVKGIPHCERYLNDAKARYKNVEIIQLPHFALSSIRKEGIYCNADPKQRIYKLLDIDNVARHQTGCNVSFYGMKKSDSMNRRLMLKGYEDNICNESQKAYPLADFTNKEVLSYIKIKRLPMPVSYEMGQSNALGFNKPCFRYMMKNDKQGLEMILSKYPMAQQIVIEIQNEQEQVSEV